MPGGRSGLTGRLGTSGAGGSMAGYVLYTAGMVGICTTVVGPLVRRGRALILGWGTLKGDVILS